MTHPITRELDPLFNPKSVAVIGATNNQNKWGFHTFSSTLDGFTGEVYPVNNRMKEVLGRKAFGRVTDIPGHVDMAVFVVPAINVPIAMKDCVAKGVKAAVLISAGFAETGVEGKKLQDEVLSIARQGGIRFIGPNCMGYWSASSNLRAFMMPLLIEDGPLAFVTQGGNVGGAVVMSGHQLGIGFHRYVSCGCTADIQVEDYIECFGDDPKVKVILAYIEGLTDGRRFLEKVKKVTPKKPVIVLKAGKTSAAAGAITSHSGSLAGSNETYNAAFKSIGVTRVDNPEELLDVAIGFLYQPLPKGRNVAILTPGGSYGVLCAGDCASEGLNVLALPDETIAALDKVFPPRWSRRNPVDPAGDRNFIGYLTAPEKLLQVENVDSLIFVGFGGFSTFAPTMFSMDSNVGAGLAEMIPAISTAFESQDVAEISKIISPAIATIGSAMGTHDEEIQRLTRLIASAIAARRIAPLFQSISPSLPGSSEAENVGAKETMSASEAIAGFMFGLVEQWIADYGKPVLTTTFGEGTPQLSSSRFVYPSSRAAARVLVKMVEYKEYLERIGIYQK